MKTTPLKFKLAEQDHRNSREVAYQTQIPSTRRMHSKLQERINFVCLKQERLSFLIFMIYPEPMRNYCNAVRLI